MRLNPPEVYAVGTIYQIWAHSQRTPAWEGFGQAMSIMAIRLGGWCGLHQWLVDWLPSIPVEHAKLALADYQLRASKTLFAK